ncbi:Zn-dependent hydrolase [Paenibacillus sacheonensis]|uniref:Hydantoinase/carbamoylase family amidase n=1 Tax=Paenibacillus sacheonensis TaxID=742054 RepID=A0A7X4YL00_9BACL|nr:Zn-dependent hydrolase [Paenibacillus sacheonensis]MBM7563145.1 allantoate deiminase [Paenibacillus sacheonensis]NBC68291.1 hydantoinase/carbamoylase family amidase [Paenibacillus sacheonensis]
MKASDYRLQTTQLLAGFASVGQEQDGGVTRLLYDAAWQKAQQAVASTMREAGLSVSIDTVGNVFGRLEGTDEAASTVMTGSHIDTVRSGGHYDGALGVAAGIAALARLKKTYGQPRRTLEVAAFCEEEGSRFPLAYWGSGNVTGSKDFTGSLDAKDPEGVSLRAAMLAAGYDPEEHGLSKRTDIGVFAELHIEQGEVLEREGTQIGIVDAIFGQRRYFVEIEGRSGHAGTTPMTIRADALAAGAEMIGWLRQAAIAAGDGLVATVGKLDVQPNLANVIPGKVRLSLDIRHRNETVIAAFCKLTLDSFSTIAERYGTSITMECWLAEQPSPMNEVLQAEISRVCDALGYSHRRMSSGAGHDAGLFAASCRTAMIFVPSRAGISHSPLEYTPPEDMERGTQVLTALLYALAYGEDER